MNYLLVIIEELCYNYLCFTRSSLCFSKEKSHFKSRCEFIKYKNKNNQKLTSKFSGEFTVCFNLFSSTMIQPVEFVRLL